MHNHDGRRDRRQAAYGASPIFWLDKACIDQENLRDGLRALPINIMGRSSSKLGARSAGVQRWGHPSGPALGLYCSGFKV